MGYYMAGDYYQAGGIFDIVKGIGKFATGVVGSLGIPVVSGVAKMGHQLLSGPGAAVPFTGPMVNMQQPQLKIPKGVIVGGGMLGPPMQYTVQKKRRRMNPGNAKALRRAIRREEAFVNLAKRSLKGTKYQITTRTSSRRRRDLGPGHTHVR